MKNKGFSSKLFLFPNKFVFSRIHDLSLHDQQFIIVDLSR